MTNSQLILKRFMDEVDVFIHENRKRNRVGKMSVLSMFKNRYENSHSDVLRFLLHPQELHQHYTEYLELFLKEIEFDVLINTDLNNAKVFREYSIDNQRRIDILVQINKSTCIIIENKIDAYDQNAQLHDYYRGMKKRGFSNIYIIYLTLWGYDASDKSLHESKEIFVELASQGKFVNISYQKHILQWLKKLTFKCMEHTLRSSIEQYIYLIELLTQQTEEENDMKDELIEIIKNYHVKDNIKEFKIIRDLLNEYIRVDALNPCLELMNSIAEDKNEIVYIADNEFVFTNVQEFINHLLENLNSNIGIGIRISEGIVIGVEDPYFGLMKNRVAVDSSIIKKIYSVEVLEKIENGYHRDDSQYWYFSKNLKYVKLEEELRTFYNLLKKSFN